MGGNMGQTLGWLYTVLVLFAMVAAVLWVLVPFILMRMSGRLRDLLDEQRRTNDLLGRLGERKPRPFENTSPGHRVAERPRA